MATDDQGKRWRRFEQFVASIQQQMTPQAIVQHDEKIVGKSGVVRQIDVSVRQQVGQFSVLFVIDCKDWKSLVDVGDVDKFAGLLEDVGANKGAMVCNVGFTSGAKKQAEAKGIDLLRAVDAKSIEWPVVLKIPVLCDYRGIKNFSFSFVHNRPGPFAMPATDTPQYLDIYRSDGSLSDYLCNLLNQAWEQGKLPTEPGEHPYVSFLSEDAYTKVDDKIYGPVEITVSIGVNQRLFFGGLRIEEGCGFQNQRGVLITNKITTEALLEEDVQKNWRRVNSPSECSASMLITFIILDTYKKWTP